MGQQQTFKRKISFLVSVALGLTGLTVGPAALASGIVTTQTSMQAQHAAINNLTTDLGIFEYAAQKWAVDNLSNLPWNQSGSTTPITYAPRLVYDGNPALCYGSQGLTASNLGGPPVDLTQQKTQNGNAFLPATFRAPYAGTYCAAIVPNATTTTVKIKVKAPSATNGGGANGGGSVAAVSSNGTTSTTTATTTITEIIPVAGVQAILVPGKTASRDPLLKNQDPSVFAAVHGTQGNTQYHVQTGTAIMQQGPAAGQNTSSGSSFSWAGMALSGGSGMAASFMTQPLSAMGVMSTSGTGSGGATTSWGSNGTYSKP